MAHKGLWQVRREAEKEYVKMLIARHGDDVHAMVRTADVSLRYLYRILKRHGVTFGMRVQLSDVPGVAAVIFFVIAVIGSWR